MTQNSKIIFVATAIIILAGVTFISIKNRSEEKIDVKHPLGGQYAGDLKCQSCHQQTHHDFTLTAHMKSTSVASLETVKGSFEKGKNEIQLPRVSKILLKSLDSGLYQIGMQNDEMVKSQKMDIVVGSGTRGQTYLHWEDQKLIQLPVSYNSQGQNWSPVPGSSFDNYRFRRTINAGCMNCHSTHMEVIPTFNQSHEFDRSKSMLGITCERCHGPSKDHVTEMQTSINHQNTKTINPKRLNRRQQLDICAQCHSSIKSPIAPFYFLPGDSLQRFDFASVKVDTSNTSEVHGNQYDLLSNSKCFLHSEMTCSTCHDTHKNEHGLTAVFNARCQSCHQEKSNNFCSFKFVSDKKLKENCTECHMTVRSSKAITFDHETKSKKAAETVRSHFISINKLEANKIASFLNTKN